MKKRKLITLVLSLASCLALVIGLSACKPEGPRVPIHTHSYTKEIVAPTCTEKGYTKHTCACGDEQKDTYVDELGHSYSEWESNGDGTHTKTCINDSDHFITEDCEGGTATCTKKPICGSCGEGYGLELGHSFTNYISDGKGKQKATCDRGCGVTDTLFLVFTLNEESNAYTLTGYTQRPSRVVIPAVYEGFPVIAIGIGAFEYCYTLTEVVIPGSVKTINEDAFRGCNKLTKVTLSVGITTLGSGAFEYCTGLTEIVIPDSVTTIGGFAFASCTGLTEIIIPNSVTAIYASAFSSCTGLREVVIPNSVTTLVGGVFADCERLVKVVLPEGITSIGDSMFSNCKRLTRIDLPNSITKIGHNAFSDCTGLKEIVIPDGVTFIDMSAFCGCSSLTEIVIPKSVTAISLNVFEKCDKLRIYCEAESQPSSWATTWNSDNRPVVWGYTGE